MMALFVRSLLAVTCILICGVFCETEDVSTPRVIISQGTVVGTAAVNNNYFEFYGIPFADSTAGINRFKAPSAPPLFQHEFIANRKNVKCVRSLRVGYEGTEDCLVVDVLTPSLDNATPLPVMVWVKGKELDTDIGLDLSFKRFLDKNVVVVNMNYRESILGFLCLGTESAPGNAGLKDIVAGLRWIQKNIAAFGGDPNNVSVFGHGSGAAAIDLVTLSPLAEGLVHKIITQSGTALAPWAVTRNNLKYAIDVAEALGHTVSSVDTLSEVFSRTSIGALMAVINELDLTDNSLAFAPCIERRIENIEPLLLKSPYTTIMDGEQLKVPFMTGFVDIEGTIRANEIINNDWLERMDNSFIDFIQPDINFMSEELEVQAVNEIKTFYFGSDRINESKTSDVLLYNGDTMILVSAIREARMRAASSNSSVYLYQFFYRSELSDEILHRPLQIESAGHKEELVYMFASDDQTDATILDLTVGDIIIERWTNFAKTGIPTSETSQVIWEPYNSTNNFYLRILDDEEMNFSGNSDLDTALEGPRRDTINFWDDVYSRFFVDAVSRWSLEDKSDDDDDDNNEEGGGDGDEGEGDGGGGSDPNSAPTMMGNTFIIISALSIFYKFNSFQIIS